MHLIRISKGKERENAIQTLLDIPYTQYLALPDHQFFLTDPQVKALEEAGVKFEYLSKTGPHDKKKTPVQRKSAS